MLYAKYQGLQSTQSVQGIPYLGNPRGKPLAVYHAKHKPCFCSIHHFLPHLFYLTSETQLKFHSTHYFCTTTVYSVQKELAGI